MDLAADYCHRSLIVMSRDFNRQVFSNPETGYPYIGLLLISRQPNVSSRLVFAAGLECAPSDAILKSYGEIAERKGGTNLPLKWDGSRASVSEVEDMSAQESANRPKLLKNCTFLAISFAFACTGQPGARVYSDARSEQSGTHRFLVLLARGADDEDWSLFVADTARDTDQARLLAYILAQLEKHLPEVRVQEHGPSPWLPISTPNFATLKYRGGGLCFYGPCADLLMVGSMIEKNERVATGLRLLQVVSQTTASVPDQHYFQVAKNAIVSLLTPPGEAAPVTSSGARSAVVLANALPLIQKVPWRWTPSSRGSTAPTYPQVTHAVLDPSRIEERRQKRVKRAEEGVRLRMSYKQPKLGE